MASAEKNDLFWPTLSYVWQHFLVLWYSPQNMEEFLLYKIMKTDSVCKNHKKCYSNDFVDHAKVCLCMYVFLHFTKFINSHILYTDSYSFLNFASTFLVTPVVARQIYWPQQGRGLKRLGNISHLDSKPVWMYKFTPQLEIACIWLSAQNIQLTPTPPPVLVGGGQ
jgi:hypothetical protein